MKINEDTEREILAIYGLLYRIKDTLEDIAEESYDDEQRVQYAKESLKDIRRISRRLYSLSDKKEQKEVPSKHPDDLPY